MDFNRTYENRSQTEILETKVDGLNNRLQYLEHFIYLENKVKEQTELISKLSEQITYDKKQKNEESERQSNVISKLSGELKVMEAKKTPQETTDEVTQLKERVSLLEALLQKTVQTLIMSPNNPHNYSDIAMWYNYLKQFSTSNLKNYNEKRGLNKKKFFVNVHLKDSKDWRFSFSPGPTWEHILVTPDYTNNSIRIYENTGKNIGFVPFKAIGIDNKTTTYSFYIILSPDTIELRDSKGRGDSFMFELDVENHYIWESPNSNPTRSIEQIFE